MACSGVAECRAQTEAAIAQGDFERAHDLAWRTVQQGPRNDRSLMFLLARTQALSNRPDDALVMITLRWPEEVRGLEGLELDKSVSAAAVDKKELQMAKRLVEDMTEKWKPEQYKDTFQDQIMELVEKKAREGKLEAVGGPEEAVDRRSADVIDLTELLKRSLGAKVGKKPAKTSGKPAPAKKPRKAAGD